MTATAILAQSTFKVILTFLVVFSIPVLLLITTVHALRLSRSSTNLHDAHRKEKHSRTVITEDGKDRRIVGDGAWPRSTQAKYPRGM